MKSLELVQFRSLTKQPDLKIVLDYFTQLVLNEETQIFKQQKSFHSMTRNFWRSVINLLKKPVVADICKNKSCILGIMELRELRLFLYKFSWFSI